MVNVKVPGISLSGKNTLVSFLLAKEKKKICCMMKIQRHRTLGQMREQLNIFKKVDEIVMFQEV